MKTARKGRQSAYISIRSKLVAAVAMLLVASFMVVSSSYAWFTLSTAPEVKGIATQVGANGNLEIALDKGATVPETAVGDATGVNTNYTWGNLVNLSSANLGLDQIKLMPTRLNVSNGTLVQTNPLLYPEYAADGRIEDLKAVTSVGYYANNGFNSSADTPKTGVLGIGNATSMSEQQVDYNAALATAALALESASRDAKSTLGEFGKTMASIAATHAQAGDTDNNEYDLTKVHQTLEDLTVVVDNLDKLALNYIRAYIAKANETATSEAYTTAKAPYYVSTISDETLGSWITGSTPVVTNAALTAAWEVRTYVNNAVTDSLSAFPKTESENPTVITTGLTWNETTAVLTGLADISTVTIAGETSATLKQNLGSVISTMSSGVPVVLKPPAVPNTRTGDGVYCELAKLIGNFNVKSQIVVTYGGDNFTFDAWMRTEVSANDMVDLTAAAPGKPVASSSSANIINDLYGYALQLVFRTNAKDSNLMLQTEAVDRIYTGNSNAQTMGSGSKMTFKLSDDISAANQANLLKALRIVFAQDSNIIAVAGINTGENNVNIKTEGNQMSAPIELFSDFSFDANGKMTVDTFAAKKDGKAELIPLTQNQGVRIQVYVYLDGDYVTNSDVAYDDQTSLTGTMSLQFSSDASLVPMNYAPLKSTVVSGGSTETPAESTQTPAESTEP